MENIVENKWISVSEKMPEPMNMILFIEQKKHYKHIHLGYLSSDKIWCNENYDLGISERITHWMPLPELPTT